VTIMNIVYCNIGKYRIRTYYEYYLHILYLLVSTKRKNSKAMK
jgi:hypothetical protein